MATDATTPPVPGLPRGGPRELFRSPAAPGVALMPAALAFAWANSPWSEALAEPALLATAKIGILGGSLIAGVLGVVVLLRRG